MAYGNENELDDDLSDLIGSPRRETPVTSPAGYKSEFHTEPCKACRGTGSFVSWSGRTVGPCFKCKGQGSRTFRTTPEAREAARNRTAEKKVDKARELMESVRVWAEQHKDVAAWIEAKKATFDFAASMGAALLQWGSLTDNQLAACHKCIARDAERAAERAVAATNRKDCDASKLTSAFANARAAAAADGEGIKFLKLRVGSFTFSPDRASVADVWVKADGAWLGKTEGGKFKPFKACTPELESQIIAICDDPKAAAEAHGLRTGSCSCCGRELTNAESRARGIGPICAAKWGM